MAEGFDWTSLIQPAMSLGGGMMQSQATGASSARDRSDSKAAERRRRAAYDEMIARANQLSSGGEQSFLAETAAPLGELEAARQGALTGQSEAMQQGAGQMGANLAQQGVRGGQASTLLNRGTGQMSVDATRDINQMALQEADQRRKLRTGLFGQKANTGYSGQLQQFGG